MKLSAAHSIEDLYLAGYEVLPCLDEPEVCNLADALAELTSGNNSNAFGIRNLLRTSKQVQALAIRNDILELVRSVLGPSARAVKATFFDKTPSANWKVPPHQDVTIALREQLETPGYGPWTMKAGVPNVQPTTEILEQMLALRFHLDDCNENNGALKVWPGSHLAGRLKDSGITEWTSGHSAVICRGSKRRCYADAATSDPRLIARIMPFPPTCHSH